MPAEAEKVTINVNKDAMTAIRAEAQHIGMETSALIQRAVHQFALDSGRMQPEAAKLMSSQNVIVDRFVALSKRLFSEGRFDEHFVLTVFETAMNDPDLRALYEQAVGGDAYAVKLPGKTPLNMYLGWYIKNALEAEPIVDSQGRPMRVQVRGQPIQSYTLLRASSV